MEIGVFLNPARTGTFIAEQQIETDSHVRNRQLEQLATEMIAGQVRTASLLRTDRHLEEYWG